MGLYGSCKRGLGQGASVINPQDHGGPHCEILRSLASYWTLGTLEPAKKQVHRLGGRRCAFGGVDTSHAGRVSTRC